VMVLQAGAAAALRERDPPRARTAVRTITATAAEALAQVDELFGLLDAGTVGAAGLAAAVPAADLVAALTALAERARHAGLRVRLDVVGAGVSDPAVTATTYRIVQEALTNAMRHAPGSTVAVRVGRDDGGVEVCVRDDGAAGGALPGGRGGFGLLGLGERVAALGGELSSGPLAGGGFEVRAVLPVGRPVGTPP
ncbi:MAG TPA: ATP-binding protein, partial [Egibacteraceae bacterium]